MTKGKTLSDQIEDLSDEKNISPKIFRKKYFHKNVFTKNISKKNILTTVSRCLVLILIHILTNIFRYLDIY